MVSKPDRPGQRLLCPPAEAASHLETAGRSSDGLQNLFVWWVARKSGMNQQEWGSLVCNQDACWLKHHVAGVVELNEAFGVKKTVAAGVGAQVHTPLPIGCPKPQANECQCAASSTGPKILWAD